MDRLPAIDRDDLGELVFLFKFHCQGICLLLWNILSFDQESYEERIRLHHQECDSYENGTATKQLVARICRECGIQPLPSIPERKP